MKERIFIFDKYDKLLAITNNYVEAVFEETVEKPVSFTITFPMSDENASYLIGGNQVAFRDLTGKFRLFTIREVDDVDGESPEKIVQCMPAIQELADVMVENNALENESADVVLSAILKKSRWLVGNVADLGLNAISFSYQNAYMCLGKLTELWGGEIVDRVEIAGNKIVGRYLDIVQRKGADTGKRFEMDKDIKNITRTVLYYPKTALYGHGKSIQSEKEGSGKVTFRNVEWIKENGDPTNKPKGQEWVGDPDALEKHGVPNHETGKLMHRFGLFEDNEEEDPERLLAKTWQAVQHEKDPKVQYEMDIITFYGIADYEHEQVFLGDTGIARDKDMKPMILIEARIMSWEYDIGNPRDGSLILGNILDLDPDDSEIDWVIDKVKEGSGNWDAGGGPITDERFPDIVPDAPQNVSAIGLFKKIMLSWTFESTYMIATYEVYASQMNGFVPDPTNLVFRGKVGAYNFDANTDEKWYFRVRAVNTHGTASEYSEQVSASTVQLDLPDIENIVPDFIEFGIFKGEEAPSSKDYKYWLDISKEPNILRHWDEESETWKPLAPEYAGDIGAVSFADYHEQVNEIIADIADKADLEWVNGQLISKANKDDVYTMEQLDNKFDNVVSKTTYESDKQGIITDLRSQESRISQTEKDIKSKVSNTQYQQDKKSLETSINENKSSIEQNAKAIASKVSSSQYQTDKQGIITDIKENKSKIEQNANSIKSKVDSTYVQGEIGKIEVGGRNLLLNTTFENGNNHWSGISEIVPNAHNGNAGAVNERSEYTGRERRFLVQRTTARMVLIPSKTYTLSGWFYIDSRIPLDSDNNTFHVRKYQSRDRVGFKDFISVPIRLDYYDYDKWYYFEETASVPDGYVGHEDVTLALGKNGRIIFSELQLEKGNKATSHQLAPEDVEAKIDGINVGGRNLLLKSNVVKENTTYNIAGYDLTESIKHGEEVTISIKGKLGSDREKFGIYNSGGWVVMTQIFPSDQKSNGVYVKTFKWVGEHSKYPPSNTHIQFYQMPASGKSASKIEWIKLEKGNKATDWIPAPEDVQSQIDSQAKIINRHTSEIEQTAKSIKSKVDSTYVNNAISDSKSRNYGYKYAKDIVIYGDSNKYYPVIIKGGDQYVMRDILIKRGYSEQAPNDWYSPTHRAALTVLIKANFGGWGGTRYAWDIYALNQEYAETFAGAEHVATYNMFAIFLRGGGETGALYHLYSDQTLTHNKFYQTPDGDIPPSPQIAYNKDLIFYALEGKYIEYAPDPRTLTDEVRKEIKDHSFIDLGKETAKEVKTVKQYASEIEQTAKGIKQDVTALETDYSTFKNQTNSTLKQQASQIESKVTKTEYKVDIDGLRVKVNNAESSIKQNADNIVSKVSKNGVVSSINQSPEQIKISAERVSIDGDLVVKNGKVYIKDGVITNKLIAGSAKIDGAKIADATITNAKISSINADKIKAGIIDTNKVLIQVKNGTQAIQIDDKGFQSVDSKGKVRIFIGVRDIAGKGQSDPSTIIFYGGYGNTAGSIGSNVNDDLIIGSKNGALQFDVKKNMLYYAQEHRFVSNNNRRYWRLTTIKNKAGQVHPSFKADASGWGYIGGENTRIWKVYSNHLYYYDLHKLSTRERKENIQNLLPETAQQIFDQISIKKYHYKNDDNLSSLRKESYGPIAEEIPSELLSVEGNSIIQDNYINVIAGALKYQQKRIDNLEKTVKGWS